MTASLRTDGHTVTNPAEINPDGGTWNDCRRHDIDALIADRLGMTVENAQDLVSMG